MQLGWLMNEEESSKTHEKNSSGYFSFLPNVPLKKDIKVPFGFCLCFKAMFKRVANTIKYI